MTTMTVKMYRVEIYSDEDTLDKVWDQFILIPEANEVTALALVAKEAEANWRHPVVYYKVTEIKMSNLQEIGHGFHADDLGLYEKPEKKKRKK